MPNTRPRPVAGADFQYIPGKPFKDGVCQACRNFDTRASVDWEDRLRELEEICNKHRSKDGSWDCIIPVSGGKDSHGAVYWIKEVMGMNPLLITAADPFTKTKAGIENYRNIGEAFNCDQILGTVSSDLAKRLIKSSFEKYLDPLRFIEQMINTIPFIIGSKLGIPLSFKGESPYIYGSVEEEEKSALSRVLSEFTKFDYNFWLEHGAKKEEINFLKPLESDKLKKLNPEVYYMSYFAPWSSLTDFDIAKRYGFVDLSHEWKREGCMEDFEQIDSMGYIVHLWLKYPKFGFQRVSDIASRRIREGALTTEEAKKIILAKDHKLDQMAQQDFIDLLGYTRKEFWDIVEPFWNTEIFEKKGPVWKMKTDRFPNQ